MTHKVRIHKAESAIVSAMESIASAIESLVNSRSYLDEFPEMDNALSFQVNRLNDVQGKLDDIASMLEEEE